MDLELCNICLCINLYFCYLAHLLRVMELRDVCEWECGRMKINTEFDFAIPWMMLPESSIVNHFFGMLIQSPLFLARLFLDFCM